MTPLTIDTQIGKPKADNVMSKLVKFAEFGDHRGGLVALEEGSEIPFKIKRIYYIYNTSPSISRGFHAHENLKQVVICVSGQCRFVVESEHGREEYILNNPAEGVFIEGLKWREMHDLSSDCVLLVVASEVYNDRDYIRNYDEFRQLLKRRTGVGLDHGD
tara:strand:- start:561 stop:1040 length:480 start_codon:yes stop_codon:yes gene_type:complete